MTKKALEKQLEQEITQLFGKSNYTRIASPCRGKWACTTDYGLQFDDGTYLSISNGKKNYISTLEREISQIKGFYQNKETIISMLNNTVFKADREKAAAFNKNYAELIDIRITPEAVGVYAKIKDSNGNVYEHRESNLAYAVMNGLEAVTEYINRHMSMQIIPTAHNYKESECNMILCGYLWNVETLDKVA